MINESKIETAAQKTDRIEKSQGDRLDASLGHSGPTQQVSITDRSTT